MGKPTEHEIENWRRDVDMLLEITRQARREEPQPLSTFNHDLQVIVRSLAEPTRCVKPIAAIFRMVRRLGYAISPNSTPQEARKVGRVVLGRLRSLARVFDVEVRDDWKTMMRERMEEYDHACIATFFVERVRDLSKPGGVSDRIEKFNRGVLPRYCVELDLALSDPGKMSRSNARRQAAREAAQFARQRLGYLPREWDPQVSDRQLQRRHAELLEPHLRKGYWSREGRQLTPPTISLHDLKRSAGRPRKI